MKADVHYDKAEKIATSQSTLNPVTDTESIVELCYMSAHHYILAGTEWAGTAHFQSHAIEITRV